MHTVAIDLGFLVEYIQLDDEQYQNLQELYYRAFQIQAARLREQQQQQQQRQQPGSHLSPASASSISTPATTASSGSLQSTSSAATTVTIDGTGYHEGAGSVEIAKMVQLGSGLCEYEPGKWSYWYYCPDGTLPIVFAVLFAVSGITHAMQAWYYRNKYMPIYVVGCSLLAAGLSLRAYTARSGDLQSLGLLIPSQVLVYSGPPVFSAALFFVFARLCYYVPQAAPITPYRIVRTFISLDGLCELLVGAGTGMFVNTTVPERQKIGQGLLRAAVILQMLLFLAFAWFAVKLQRNARQLGIGGKWKKSLYTLYVCGFWVMVRCLYRLVEFIEGFDGELIRHEAYFYGLECIPMLLSTGYMNVMHVGRWLPRKSTVYLLEDGVTEAEGEGFQDNRPVWKKIADPYDFEGIYLGVKSLVLRIAGKRGDATGRVELMEEGRK
ncbi:hypothetical protein DRE_07491 [Drechslerella stenobrocha 248]|uniref:RTA1 domain protein n=1 Tax=Drechslerella stenobrocha 248 TaxID=1043628 RepID=W7HKJ5_9PEZI|nr:hypothetical protein DRE_07491 [Drechslerella stenobrocha 248]